jgi:hypothetical protein
MTHAARLFSLLVAAAILAGCSSVRYGDDQLSPEERNAIRQAQNIPPTNHRADIVAYMRNYLNDPTGVRNASVSQPVVKDLPTGARYIACLRYDARKTGGQYAGLKTALVVFVSGKLDRVIEPLPGRDPRDGEEVRQSAEVREACKDAAYAPFPELQAMTR